MMKNHKLVIQIHRSATDIFSFLTNPKNTPLWIDSIVAEETNEWPAKLGTIYKNHGATSEWSEYRMTKYKNNEMFVMTQIGKPYHVRYILKPIDNATTELEYYEWVDAGKLENPYSLNVLRKLKSALEKRMKVIHLKDVPKQHLGLPIFLGKVTRQSPITDQDGSDVSIDYIHFSKGSRNKFHTHSNDQILIVTQGKGMIATKQKTAHVKKGDIVWAPAGEVHWHGAEANSSFTHISITHAHTKLTLKEK